MVTGFLLEMLLTAKAEVEETVAGSKLGLDIITVDLAMGERGKRGNFLP